MKNSYKYKVGEIVDVISPGQSYPTYRELFESLGFKNKRFNGVDSYNYSHIKEKTWIVFERSMISERENVYAIRSLDDDKIELLIAEQGVISGLEVAIKNINKELNEI